MSFQWTDLEVRRALGMNPHRAQEGLVFSRISTDSRTVEPGDLFLALRGENFEGHDFVWMPLQRALAGLWLPGRFLPRSPPASIRWTTPSSP